MKKKPMCVYRLNLVVQKVLLLLQLPLLLLVLSGFNAYSISFGEKTKQQVNFQNAREQVLLSPEEKDNALVQATKRVTGKVIDTSGAPLPGVSVGVKGTANGTITDSNGNYSLPNVPEDAILQFSFVGMIAQEMSVTGRTVIDVTLVEQAINIEEVVAIGYQTVQKRDLTGATAIVSPVAANRVSAGSLAESIQGLAPGVTVRNSGAPGQQSVIEIRGVASFVNSNPLYIIDGMIADANPTINNDDIESIQILKDASAAAIYGSRAANGVIIITTKKGKVGPPRISVSVKYGIQNVPKKWDMMNNTEFAAMKNKAYTNSNLPPMASISNEFDPSINTDWQDVMMRTGSMEDYNLSWSGATDVTSYLISASHYRDKGALEGYSFQRSSLRINTESKRGLLTFGENLLLTYSTSSNPADGNPFYDMPTMLPVIAVKNSKYIDVANDNPAGWGIGSDKAVTYSWNPVAVNDLFHRTNSYSKLVGNAYIDLKLTNWLKYRFNAGLETSFDFQKSVRKQGKWGFNRAFESSFVNNDRSAFSSMLFEHTLNFEKVLNRHSINGVVGYSWQQTQREITTAGRTNLQSFNNIYYTTINSATGEASAYGERSVFYRIRGFLGRVNYTYGDKYLLTLTGRYDEDSRFGKGYRSGFFPSIAGAWRISKEGFYNMNSVNDLKLHASYGRMGIVTVGSWDYLGFLNSNPRAIFGPDQVPNVGATQATLANSNLTWETRTIKNIGLDASFLDNRFSATLELYDSFSEDALLNLPVAWYLGNLGGDPAVNAASIRNRGIEFSATYRNVGRDLKWDVSGNFTTIKNKVEDVGNQGATTQGTSIDFIQTGISRSQVGRSIGEWYVRKTNGLFQSQSEIDNYKNSKGVVIQPLAKPGDIRYVDINDDGVINGDDRTFAGSPWPTLQAGAQFNASYKHFSINIQLVGVFGYKILNGVRQVLDGYQNTNFRKGINPWAPNNTNTSDPRIGIAINDPGLADNQILESSRWLENGSYVRLRNVEIAYTLPNTLMESISVATSRIYVSGQNLFTITNYTGLDPDVVGNGILERGYDNGNWPSSRIISVGIQCEF